VKLFLFNNEGFNFNSFAYTNSKVEDCFNLIPYESNKNKILFNIVDFLHTI